MLFKPSFIAAALSLAAFGAQAEGMLALTNKNQLVQFDSTNTAAGTVIDITGLNLAVGERLLGLEQRPVTGDFYTLSSAGRLFTLNATTGAATFAGSLRADATLGASGTAFSGLSGQAFGFDFNPVPDLGQTLPSLRLVSNTGQNLRINVNGSNAGLVRVDTPINVVAANPNGTSPSVVASAYTNNDRDASTGTSLYAIDARGDALYQQVNANGGQLSYVADLKMLDMAMGLGALVGVNTTSVSSFDVSASGIAYASLTDEFTGDNWLFSVNLSGQQPSLTYLGLFGQAGVSLGSAVIGLTVTTAAPVPEPTGMALSLAALCLIGLGLRRRMV